MLFRTMRRFLWPPDLVCSCLQNIYPRHVLIVSTFRKGTEGFENEDGLGITPRQKYRVLDNTTQVIYISIFELSIISGPWLVGVTGMSLQKYWPGSKWGHSRMC